MLLRGVVVWIAVLCECVCRERNRRCRSREVGGGARQADGTAASGSSKYGLMRFVFLRDLSVLLRGIVVWIAVCFVCECGRLYY